MSPPEAEITTYLGELDELGSNWSDGPHELPIVAQQLSKCLMIPESLLLRTEEG
jgi:hypothetical protein